MTCCDQAIVELRPPSQIHTKPYHRNSTLAQVDLKMQYWIDMEKLLPPDGVAAAFPTDLACRDRMASVLWPDGPVCERCGETSVGYLQSRRTYHCRVCRYQFTVLTGTLLRSSKLSPLLWFQAAEEYVRWRARHGSHDFGIQALAEIMGVAYPTGYRIRRILADDFSPEGPRFLARCICVADGNQRSSND